MAMAMAVTIRVLCTISLFAVVLSNSVERSPRATIGNGRTRYANVTGELLLGGLFPVHRKGNNGKSCGEIQGEDGVQPLEAMLYTIERINENPRILPGVRLGALAFDTCDHPIYALEQAFYFVKGFMALENRSGEEGYRCADRSVAKFLNGELERVVAVLGAQSSSVTIQVASVLALFPVPQISYMATSPFLSSKERFPRFFRTVPSDVNQARAMLEVLRRFEWSYVSVVYTDSEYGDHGYETLASFASEYSICFSAPHRISEDRFTDDDYDNVVRTIAEKTDVRVVVLFAEKSTTLRVLEAARRVGVGSRFVWLGSDSWPDNRDVETRETAVLEGALAVQPLYAPLSGFDEYFTGLTLDHERSNPWFREFWRTYHNCTDDELEATTIAATSGGRHVDCQDPRLRIERSTGYKQRRFLHFVRDAVYAVAHALHNMRTEVCGQGSIGLCDEMRPPNMDAFFEYLTNVSFKDEAGNAFEFVDAVDGPPRYSILNYQRKANGFYHWAVIGNYTRKTIYYLSLFLSLSLSLFFAKPRVESEGERERMKETNKRKDAYGIARSERKRASGFAAGSGQVVVSRRTARRFSDVVVFPAVRLESNHGEKQRGSVLLEVSKLRFLSIQGGRAEMRRVRAGHDSDEERVWLRTYPRTVRRLLESVGDRRDDGSRFRYGTDRVRLLGVLDLSAYADDQSVRSRAVVSVAGRRVRLLLDDVRRGVQAQRGKLRRGAIRHRILLHRLLRRALHQDQSNSQDIQRSRSQSPQTTVHQPEISADDRVDSRSGGDRVRRRLAAQGTTGDPALVSQQGRERKSVSGLRRRLLRDRFDLPVPVDRRVHVLRDQDEKVPGGIQRDPTHRVRQLRDDRAVAGVRAPLLGLHEQRRQGNYSGVVAVAERTGPAALPVSAEGLRGADQTGEEHERAGDGQALVSPDDARYADHAGARVRLAVVRRRSIETGRRRLSPVRANFRLTRR